MGDCAAAWAPGIRGIKPVKTHDAADTGGVGKSRTLTRRRSVLRASAVCWPEQHARGAPRTRRARAHRRLSAPSPAARQRLATPTRNLTHTSSSGPRRAPGSPKNERSRAHLPHVPGGVRRIAGCHTTATQVLSAWKHRRASAAVVSDWRVAGSAPCWAGVLLPRWPGHTWGAAHARARDEFGVRAGSELGTGTSER
jgi:hypothetical protein